MGYDDQVNLYAYVGNDPVNLKDPSGKVAAAAIPVIEIVGVAAACYISGACQSFSEALSKGWDKLFNENVSDGTISADGKGKVHGDLPDPSDVSDDNVKDSIKALDESIKTREAEVEEKPKGDPNGSRNQRDRARQHENHVERIRREKDLREKLKTRLDE